MRPLVLKMSAFGPYAGATVIPMQDLGEKGLYLVTGDTGAGKTTIFDAICYALFGEPSGDSRAVSMFRSKYADPNTPTEVELTFLHNGEEYRIVRNPEYERPAKRGGGTTKQVADACLYLPDGKIITKIKDVTVAIEDLLGINRDQFSQIVMIAQGDFKKLLLADTKQRQEILRELFKTGYYQKLQFAIEEKRKEIYARVKSGNDSVKQYIDDIIVGEDDVLAMEVNKAKKGELITSDILMLIEKILEQDNSLKSKADKELYDVNKELEIINSRIGAAETTINAKIALEKAEEELYIEIPKEEKLREAFENAKIELKKKDELTKRITEIEAELKKHDNIEMIQKELEFAEADIIRSSKALVKKGEEKKLKEIELEKLKEEHDSIKDVSVLIEKYKNELEKIKATVSGLEELSESTGEFMDEGELLKEAQEKYVKDDADFHDLQSIYEQKEQAFRDGQAGILAASLRDGDKCPVCGSTSHPQKAGFSSDVPSEKEVDAAKKDADKAREKASESAKAASSIKTSLELKAESLKKNAAKLLGAEDINSIEDAILLRQKEAASAEKEIVKNLKSEEEKAKRKMQIEESLPQKEKEIKRIENDISSEREQLSGKKAAVSEKKNQIHELKRTLSFSDKEKAEKEKNEFALSANTIQENYDKADKDLKDVSTSVAALKAQIESSKKTLDAAPDIDVEAEKEKQIECRTKQDLVINTIKDVGSRIDRNEDILMNIKKQSEKIAETEKQLQWMASLSDTANGKLRGAEKITLETYIQATYFDRIINKANLRFMKMSDGQYELKRMSEATDSRSQSGLELGVIDHYNGTQRSVKTLSGGESFMASLSLALGLSDEVQSSAGGINIDTMFVDEGFGSLDSDSLDQAYKALVGITEGNRLVGIISHVAELKNKIDNQLIVKKEKSGGSFVNIQV